MNLLRSLFRTYPSPIELSIQSLEKEIEERRKSDQEIEPFEKRLRDKVISFWIKNNHSPLFAYVPLADFETYIKWKVSHNFNSGENMYMGVKLKPHFSDNIIITAGVIK